MKIRVSCLPADRLFCAQEWDLNFWTKSPVSATSLGGDKVAATLSDNAAKNPQTQQFELQKEKGQWMITKIDCDMGVQ